MASKLKKSDKPKPSAPSATTVKASRSPTPTAQRTMRETVESIAVAFVLAFLFRTFEAEAFVIPTGSMAPTLQGRHKDLVCPECGFRYRVSASSEEDERVQAARTVSNSANATRGERDAAQRGIRDNDVVSGTCPNCRFTMDVDQFTDKGREWPSYNGDRILVAKFPYDFADPDRWDVVVFRFPGNSGMNYIKRLVGRPHETVRIRHGDIYVRPDGDLAASSSGSQDESDAFGIARKPPDKVQAMSQTVYDNDYVVDEMTNAGWPLRWRPWPQDNAAAREAWKSPDGGRSYAIGDAATAESGDSWIRYQHFIPFGDDWADITAGQSVRAPRPRLISDFYAYNSSEVRGGSGEIPMGQNWVGDLVLEATLNAQSGDGTILLDLVRAGRHARCEIALTSGEAQVTVDGAPEFQPKAKTAVRGPGRHRISFANVDRQLLLWVDGSSVEFDADTGYPAVGDDVPNQDDLAPAGIGTRGAALEVEHILLKRDVYYIATKEVYGGISDYAPAIAQRDVIDFFAEPERWTSDSLFAHRREVTFPLKADQFFVLGDNSPASKDSRLWSQDIRSWSTATHSWSGEHPEFYVSRELLIGKALFIYWPHSFDRLPFRVPFTDKQIPFPYFPNFKDMGFVR